MREPTTPNNSETLRHIPIKATAWSNLSKFARNFQKGQLVTLEGMLNYREVTEDIEGTSFKHRIAEVHATSLKRHSKVVAADNPSDGAEE